MIFISFNLTIYKKILIKNYQSILICYKYIKVLFIDIFFLTNNKFSNNL